MSSSPADMLDLQTGGKEISTKKLENVWRSIRKWEKCNDCPLIRKEPPLIMKINRPINVKVMVITEGPNKKEKKKHIASFGNHPTYTFLYTLFSGNAKFIGEEANVYWTHARKCFLSNEENKKKEGKKALKLCRKYYLGEEIKALKPNIIVGVGGEALKFFQQRDPRLKNGGLKRIVFHSKEEGIFKNVRFNDLCFTLVVLPHPSGLNRIWVNLPANAYDVLEEIRRTLNRSLRE